MKVRDTLFGARALGRELRLARDRAGVSVALAARRSGLSRRDIEEVERGRRQVGVPELEILSGLYGIALAELLPSVPATMRSISTAGNEACESGEEA